MCNLNILELEILYKGQEVEWALAKDHHQDMVQVLAKDNCNTSRVLEASDLGCVSEVTWLIDCAMI